MKPCKSSGWVGVEGSRTWTVQKQWMSGSGGFLNVDCPKTVDERVWSLDYCSPVLIYICDDLDPLSLDDLILIVLLAGSA